MLKSGDGYQCTVCSLQFPNKSAFHRHCKASHPLSKSKCQVCDRQVLKVFYWEHMKMVHNVTPASQNDSSGGGTDDMGIVKIKDEVSIDSCEDLCKVEMTVNESDKAVNYNFKGIDCYYCKQTYSNELNLKKHVYNVHRMKRVKCEICDKEVNKKSLDRHMKSVHSAASIEEKKERKQMPEDQKIPCHLCAKKCASLLSLQAHVKNIHEAQQFKCPHCNFHGVKKNLERHLKKDHTEQVYQCQRCQKVLKSKSTLKEHMWIHTDHRRFICDICGMRFKRTSNYHGHMKSHQEKKFQCQLCGNYFLRKRYLVIHEQTIHDYYGEGVAPQEKGFQCEVCGVKLKWKNNLMAHMRIHTGEKPYKCQICGDDFTCHGSLRTHLSKHDCFEGCEGTEVAVASLEAGAMAAVLRATVAQLHILSYATSVPSSSASRSIGKKLHTVIQMTEQELRRAHSFQPLFLSAREEARKMNEAQVLEAASQANKERIASLRNRIRNIEKTKYRELHKKQEVIASLKDQIQDLMSRRDVTLSYVEHSKTSQKDENLIRCGTSEQRIKAQLDLVNEQTSSEVRVHQDLCQFLTLEMKNMEDEIEKWTTTYDDEIIKRKAKIKTLQEKIVQEKAKWSVLKELYEEHQKEMNEYLDYKEMKRLEAERDQFIYDSATKIQAWWRGTMVRRGLGQYKKRKKPAKEKKKQKK